MKVYITKLALTKGIIEIDDPEFYSNYVVIDDLQPMINQVDWFYNKPAAIKRAEEMRVNKIASLKKQLAKLESLKFE
jgi:hypothetical protein